MLPTCVRPSSSKVICATTREVARLAGGDERLAHLFQVAEGFEDDQVHPALKQRLDLLAENAAGLKKGDEADRLDRLAERPNRAGHDHRQPDHFAHFARYLRAAAVDLLYFVGKVVGGELEAVRAVGVGLDNLGAGLDVCFVHSPHHIGRGQVQLVEAGIGGRAHRIEHCAHRAIADYGRRLSEPGKQRVADLRLY